MMRWRQERTDDIHLYALLAQSPLAKDFWEVNSAFTMGEHKVDHKSLQTMKDSPAQLLIHTPTLVVKPSTLQQFFAREVPLLIATDSNGIIRLIQEAPENAFNQNAFVEQVANKINQYWAYNSPMRQSGNDSHILVTKPR